MIELAATVVRDRGVVRNEMACSMALLELEVDCMMFLGISGNWYLDCRWVLKSKV